MAMEKERGSNQQFLILGASLLAIATILSIIGHSLGVNTLTGNYQTFTPDTYDGSGGRTPDSTRRYQYDMNRIFNSPDAEKLTGRIIYQTSDKSGSGMLVISIDAGAREMFFVPASKNPELSLGDMVEITLNNDEIRDIQRMG